MANVTMIPATKNKFTALPITSMRKRHVAGYARVSTDSEEQLTSYEAQVDYYTRLIQSKPEWDFVKVYTDEGISATNTKHREGFNQMVKDALAGKIDLIVTKSVSRFARNTVDSLTTIRKLKEAGCECFFEKENIMTFDSKGELLITIMSSLAQEESRSISENVTWGQRKRFADGKVKMPYKRFLGYEKGEDDTPRVVEAEAKIVRLIYRLFLDGKTACGICKHLEKMGIPTPSNGTKWSQSTVMSILQNEKYKGDALLQKKFTVDFLQKKMKTNEGEVPQYYVEGSHEAIIEADEWEMVQTEIKRRNALGRRYSGNSIFSTRLICADCGDFYGSKVWHSNDRYRKVIWRCNSKFTGHSKCTTPTLEDSTIKEKFMVAYNRFLPAKEHIIEDCEFIREQLTDPGELDREIARLTEELTVIAELVKKAIKDNADSEQSQEEYEAKYNALVKRYEKTNASLQKAEASKAKRMARDTELRLFISSLKKQGEIMLEWDDTLWRTLVECGKVHQDGSITFRFKDGTEITVE